MIYCCDSADPKIQPTTQTNDDIIIFCQFFVHPNKERNDELKFCLRKNVENMHISKIILMNEKIYSDEELGISSEKIVQIDIGKRLLYEHVFHFINNNDIHGYYAIINTDIFFGESVQMLRHSDMHIARKAWALLRWEYDDEKDPVIYGPNGDSQDTWIFHTNNIIKPEAEKIYKFPMGVPGCDNKMIYAMHISGLEIINAPNIIRTYHYHTSNLRTYTNANRLPKPYGVVFPFQYNPTRLQSFVKIDNYSFYDNKILREYIETKIKQKRKFIIPRLHTIELNLAYLFHMYTKTMEGNYSPETYKQLQEKIVKENSMLKHYTGIALADDEQISAFSADYLMSIDKSELYCAWSHYDGIMNTQSAVDLIKKNYPSKQSIWGGVMDVFHYIYMNPWTHSLQNKKILIISNYEDSIIEQIKIREKIYGMDLFPSCTIVTLPSPAKYGGTQSLGYFQSLKNIYKKIDKMGKSYDVALIAAGGYSASIANYVYDCGKSAIVVGDALLLYFGLYDSRLLKERSDIFRIYLNTYWKNVNGLENRCELPYW